MSKLRIMLIHQVQRKLYQWNLNQLLILVQQRLMIHLDELSMKLYYV